MKSIRYITFAFVAILALGSCQSKKAEEEAARQQAIAEATREQLTEAINDRDELLDLVNQISNGMEQIKGLENVLNATNRTGETADRRREILDDIAAIQETMQANRERLAQLEKKLSESNTANSKLRETIANLNAQIDAQAQEIEALKNNLVEANQIIGRQAMRIDTLTQAVDVIEGQRQQAQAQAQNLADQLNTVWYAIGTKSELKEHGIIDSGFLRKTKVLEGDFDRNYFFRGDKRTLTRIETHSKKAEVLTGQPEGSYYWGDFEDGKVLIITNPDLFWEKLKFLVIKID